MGAIDIIRDANKGNARPRMDATISNCQGTDRAANVTAAED